MGWNPLRDHPAKTTARPEFSLIALICAGYEKTIQKESWRSAEKGHFHYLNQLTAWGYVDRTKMKLLLGARRLTELLLRTLIRPT